MTSRIPPMTRRDAIAVAAGALGFAAAPVVKAGSDRPTPIAPGRRIKQSVSRWTFGSMALPDLCRAAKAIGLVAIDLLQPEEWPVVREAGLVPSLG